MFSFDFDLKWIIVVVILLYLGLKLLDRLFSFVFAKDREYVDTLREEDYDLFIRGAGNSVITLNGNNLLIFKSLKNTISLDIREINSLEIKVNFGKKKGEDYYDLSQFYYRDTSTAFVFSNKDRENMEFLRELILSSRSK